MKVKKILLKISAIVQFLYSGFVALVAGIMIFASKLINGLIGVAYEDMKAQIDEMGVEAALAEDKSLELVVEMSKDEFVKMFSFWTNILAIFMLVTIVLGIVYGVFAIIYARKYESKLMGKTKKKVWLGVLTVLFTGIGIPSILTIIALSLREKKSVETISPVK